jgi:hypothetical protein
MNHRVIIYCEDDEVARFQYAIHAHHALTALSKFDSRQWRLVDTRFAEEVVEYHYRNGKCMTCHE